MILRHETVTAEGAASERFIYFLHGIFGSGRNWASVARRLVQARPHLGVRLIELRQHGASQGFAAPHTIAAAAADLQALASELNEQPLAVLGHSFGGKVALMYAREHGSELAQLWMIDSTPDARAPGGSAWQMLELVRAAPREYASRDDLVALLVQHGIAAPVGQWMATNLERAGSVFRWRFDLDAIEQLMNDFFTVDLWDVIEEPPGRVQVHVVKAQESSVLTPQAIQRIQAAAARTQRVFFHEIAGGHWINADNPGALLDLLLRYLS
jgi:pimeloyl-ACP methyl ester carboxylesterase